VADAAANLADQPWAEVRAGRITPGLLGGLDLRPDVVVLDPPRAGVGRDVMTAALALGARVVGYLSCDPATLARDVRTAHEQGWRLTAIRAFDAFPMTHHAECLATLQPDNDQTGP
jgi:tRNA/tmRNA/rRNA uracil-C5-methylase (TrmA/RlmC/RlmD family)